MNWNSLQIGMILWCWRKLLLRGVEGGHLLIILYETFNAKKIPDILDPDFWEKIPESAWQNELRIIFIHTMLFKTLQLFLYMYI